MPSNFRNKHMNFFFLYLLFAFWVLKNVWRITASSAEEKTGPNITASTHQGGVFAQPVHSANYYVVSPGNTPENHSPTKACMIQTAWVQNSGPWDPWQASH